MTQVITITNLIEFNYYSNYQQKQIYMQTHLPVS